jgi:hypothetical protein
VMSPYLEITWLGNKFLTAAMESRAVWHVAPSFWKTFLPTKAGCRVPEWHGVATRRTVWASFNDLSHYRNILGCTVHTVFTLPPFFFSVEPIASKFRTWHGLMEHHDCDESRTLFEIHAERSQKSRFL